MLSDRGLKIKGELVKSYIVNGKYDTTPENEILEVQASEMDGDLNPNILTEHLKLLFKLSRVTSWLPGLTELERAYRSDKFKKEFPRKPFVSDNLHVIPILSHSQEEEYKKGRVALKGMKVSDWRKKND